MIPEPTYLEKGLEPKLRVMEAREEITLRCEAVSDPRLLIRYSWLRDGAEVDLNQDSDHVKLVEPNMLWMRVRGRHSGLYTCLAQTDVDEIRTEMTLRVKDVPEAPEVTEVECNERRALLRWKPAHPNAEAVFRYTVQYATKFHPRRWKKSLVEEKMDPHLFEVPAFLSLTRGRASTFFRRSSRCPPGCRTDSALWPRTAVGNPSPASCWARSVPLPPVFPTRIR